MKPTFLENVRTSLKKCWKKPPKTVDYKNVGPKMLEHFVKC
jgi:hypothetical protein